MKLRKSYNMNLKKQMKEVVMKRELGIARCGLACCVFRKYKL